MAKRIRELQALRDKMELDHTIYLEEILSYSSNPQRVAFLITRLEDATARYVDFGRELDILLAREEKPWHQRFLGK